MTLAFVGTLCCASLGAAQGIAEPAGRDTAAQPLQETVAMDVVILQRELAAARREGDEARARELEQRLIELREERMRLLRFTYHM